MTIGASVNSDDKTDRLSRRFISRLILSIANFREKMQLQTANRIVAYTLNHYDTLVRAASKISIQAQAMPLNGLALSVLPQHLYSPYASTGYGYEWRVNSALPPQPTSPVGVKVIPVCNFQGSDGIPYTVLTSYPN